MRFSLVRKGFKVQVTGFGLLNLRSSFLNRQFSIPCIKDFLPLPRVLLLPLLLVSAPLWPQAVELAVDDTTFALPSPAAADSVMTALLANKAQRDYLGATYRLGRLTGTDHYRLEYEADKVGTPQVDSVLVYDLNGQPMALLAGPLRDSRLSPGGLLDLGRGSIWQIKQRAYFSRDAGYGVAYLVEDQSVQTVEALATWDDSGDRGKIVGVVRIEMPNLLGPLRHFSLDFRRLSEINQTVKLSITEPQLPWLPVGLQLGFGQETRDTLFVRREASVGVMSRPKAGGGSMIGLGWRQLNVTSHGMNSGLLPYTQRNMQVEVERSTISAAANPTGGYRYRMHGSGGTLSGASLPAHSGLLEASFSLEWLYGLGGLTFSQDWRLQGVWGVGFVPQEADFVRVGGGATIRGYREDQYLTRWTVIARHELRYAAGDRGRLYLLSDVGLIEGNMLLAGAGFGLQLPAGRNLMMFEVAWSPDGQGHLDINAAKVHLRVVNILAGKR